MADWVLAESVPEIAEALAVLGGTTVPPEADLAAITSPARARLVKKSPVLDKETQKRIWTLGGIVFGFIAFLLLSVWISSEQATAPTPTPEVVTEVEP
ncbi:MAG: hypothetical protein P8N43_02850, partial [Alphaproteobacteria bacterium]|nr:hypothetical protein [Alphaproteobacteria bacterium]